MSSLKSQLISGAFFTAIGKYSGIVVSLLISAILARLLVPEDFGTVAIALVFANFFTLLSDFGIAAAIIQDKTLNEKDYDDIFSFTVWGGLFLILIVYFLSPILADYVGNEDLTVSGRLLCIQLFFTTINIVPNALLLKDKRFRFIAIRTVVVQLFCGIVAIFIAYRGGGIFSLLLIYVLSAIALFGVSYFQYPRKLKFSLGLKALGRIYKYSVYNFLYNLTCYFSRNLDKLMVGRVNGMAQLGYYEKSYRLMLLPVQNITYVIAPVLHPILSDYQRDLPKIAGASLKIVRLLAFIGFPLSVCLFFTSRELILLVFGPQWTEAVPIFRIFAISVGFQMVYTVQGPIFLSANAPKTMFWAGVITLLANVVALVVGLYVYESLTVVAWAISCAYVFALIETMFFLYVKVLQVGMYAFIRQCSLPLLLSGLLIVLLWPVSYWTAHWPLFISLVTKCVCAGVLVLLFVQITGEYNLLFLIRQLRHKFLSNHSK